MVAGQLVELPATAAMDSLDDVAVLVADLPVVTKKNAIAAGRAKRSGVSEMGLPRMRCSDLVREYVGIALRKVRSSSDHLIDPPRAKV